VLDVFRKKSERMPQVGFGRINGKTKNAIAK